MRSVWTLVIGTALISTSFMATGCASSSRMVRRARTTPIQARMAQRNSMHRAVRGVRPTARLARRTPAQPSYVSRPAQMAQNHASYLATPSYVEAPSYETYASESAYASDPYVSSGTYYDHAMPASYAPSSDAYVGDAYLPAETYVSPSAAVTAHSVPYTSTFQSTFHNGTPGVSADGSPTATIVDPATNRSIQILDPCGIAGSKDQWVDVSSRGGPATCTTGTCSKGACGLPSPFSGSCTDGSCDVIGGCANGSCSLPK